MLDTFLCTILSLSSQSFYCAHFLANLVHFWLRRWHVVNFQRGLYLTCCKPLWSWWCASFVPCDIFCHNVLWNRDPISLWSSSLPPANSGKQQHQRPLAFGSDTSISASPDIFWFGKWYKRMVNSLDNEKDPQSSSYSFTKLLPVLVTDPIFALMSFLKCTMYYQGGVTVNTFTFFLLNSVEMLLVQQSPTDGDWVQFIIKSSNRSSSTINISSTLLNRAWKLSVG